MPSKRDIYNRLLDLRRDFTSLLESYGNNNSIKYSQIQSQLNYLQDLISNLNVKVSSLAKSISQDDAPKELDNKHPVCGNYPGLCYSCFMKYHAWKG